MSWQNREQSETIREARNLALDILRPAKKEIEHGLELHEKSLVVDAYAFAPRCALDGDAFAKAQAGGASASELYDLSLQMMMTRCVTDSRQEEEFKKAWDAAGVTCIFQNAGEESQAPLCLIKR